MNTSRHDTTFEEREKHIANICADVSRGLPTEWACEATGIAKPTFYRWCDKHLPFKKQYHAARADFRRTMCKKILEVPDGKYYTWYLERLEAGQFGRAKVNENRATFSEETAGVLSDKDADIVDKYQAVIKDFVAQTITVDIFKLIVDCLNTIVGATELPELLAVQEEIKTMLANQK